MPLEAALGGEETLYPEYVKKMKTITGCLDWSVCSVKPPDSLLS